MNTSTAVTAAVTTTVTIDATPIPDDADRATQIRIAKRAADLAAAIRAYVNDVPISPRDIATGDELLTDTAASDASDSLIAAELTLNAISGTVIANLGIDFAGHAGHGRHTSTVNRVSDRR